MLAPSVAAVVCRNETWRGQAATEPYECAWAREAIIFVRALKPPRLPQGGMHARVQISPDGMNWVDEGTLVPLPDTKGTLTFARPGPFGGWLRVAADLPEGTEITLLVTLHLKG